MTLDFRGSEEAVQGLSPGILLSLGKIRGEDSKEGGSQESKRKTRSTGCAGNQIKFFKEERVLNAANRSNKQKPEN